MFRKVILSATLLATVSMGCKEEETANPDAGVTTPAPDMGPVTQPPAFARSAKARVQFKRWQQLATDWTAVLGFEQTSDLCAELGQFDCFEVHAIPLGGTEAYNVGIFEPLENSTVTSPLAVERIALEACKKRAEADGGAADAVIWKDVAVSADGTLTDADAPAVRGAVNRLYERALLRPMTDREWSAHRGLYDEVIAESQPDPALAWATLSCFSILTSTEALFY